MISFKGFMLNVTTPYDEGITVLSQDDAGNPRISFMKNRPAEEIESKVRRNLHGCSDKGEPDYTIALGSAQFGPICC